MRVEIYQAANGQWAWRGCDGNNRIICDGSETYLTHGGVEKALENVMTEFRGDVVVIRKDKRRRTAAAPGQEVTADRRGTTVPGYEVLAEYQAEGAK